MLDCYNSKLLRLIYRFPVLCLGKFCTKRCLYMLTNSSLSTAIHIYESHGFQRVFLEDYGGYARGDYALEKYV